MDYGYAAIGFLVGAISGFFGIGGGLIIVPALMLLFHLGIREAVATSILAITLISLSSVLTHHIHGATKIRGGIILGLSGALGVYIGAEALAHTETKVFALLFSALLLYTATKIIHFSHNKKQRECAAKKEEENTALFSAAGFFSGILSGFFGVGGGILLVPFLCLHIGYRKNTASATSSIAILLISLTGVLTYHNLGAINYSAGLSLGVMGAAGSFIGATTINIIQRWEKKNNKNYDRIFHLIFTGLLLITTAKLLLQYVF